ncbi:MAG: hypothetical protein M1825_001161 [Sarcosagium campestre]|nr:MAG: hypothetical protein M1825_001161 [Sarcosagium campestre]
MAAPIPPQPDFEVIGRSYTDLSREMGRCANLPALQEGNLILQELRGLREEQRAQGQELRAQGEELRGLREEQRAQGEELRGLREEQRALKALVTTNNDNSLSRLANSQVTRPESNLLPLRSVINNEPIPQFPETSIELQRLRDTAVTNILRALGASTMGNAATRKQRLRLQCGLKEDPV